MGSLLIHDCTLIDCTGRDPRTHAWVRVEGERIAGVGGGAPPRVDGVIEIDAAGRVLMPGLIDAHAHLSIVGNITEQNHGSLPVRFLKIAREIEETLADGFTTVRAAGRSRLGLQRGDSTRPAAWSTAFRQQWRALTDRRSWRPASTHNGGSGTADAGPLVDRDCRRRSRPSALGAREMLRRGADQIKVMANGGCVSPADDLTSVQFTVAELRAAVEEAAAQGKYVMAHTYTAASMTNCIDAGVRTLEHGNFISSGVAERMAQSGTFLVPTIATYELLAADGRSLGYPEYMIQKIEEALKGAYEALSIARQAGVRIGSGSDVLGAHQRKKAFELECKGKVMSPMEVLIATTMTNAEIIGAQNDLGSIETGKLADLLLVDGDPLSDLSVLADRSRIHMVIQSGTVVVNRPL